MQTNKTYANLSTKQKKKIKKKIDKINSLIIKKFKLNVNRHIKTSRNHNLLQI